jgi:hypothetical protein
MLRSCPAPKKNSADGRKRDELLTVAAEPAAVDARISVSAIELLDELSVGRQLFDAEPNEEALRELPKKVLGFVHADGAITLAGSDLKPTAVARAKSFPQFCADKSFGRMDVHDFVSREEGAAHSRAALR